MTRLFVYGTLKRGGDNHHHLAYQQFLGEAHTPAGYTLYSLGRYPGMVREAADTAGVTGELWAVDAASLRQLDVLEGVNEGLYERVPLKLAAPADGQPVQTYLYLGSVAGRKPLGAEFRV